ncbi:MAG: HlyC/CorC family transporter [Pseudomonadota bacterium]|nr:HlyC/CorC family transporter [Pseudomonadota bacterium]
MFEIFDLAHSIIAHIAVILALLFLSAFFSGSETALTAASQARLHQLSLRGNHRAGTVLRLRRRNDTLIGTILIGNNITNIAASALATSVLISLFDDAGVAYSMIGMTILVVIFAEVLPKTFAINNADRSALAVGPAIRVFVWLFQPLSIAIRFIVNVLLKIIGVKGLTSFAQHEREEELRGLIELHTGPGPDVSEERAMLRSILDLGEVTVEEIMTHRRNVSMINADLPLDEILDELLESPFTRLPLYRGDPDEIIGILHGKALLRAMRGFPGENMSELDIVEVANEPWFIPESSNLLDQLQAFRARKEHFAVVVDEYGTLQGVVTLEDILEEIVGNIDDENDVTVSGVRPQPDGSFLINGSVTLRDLNRDFEWSLPDEDASTIAGLILHEARIIPNVGQEFIFYGFRFRILRKHRNQVTQLRVWPVIGQPLGLNEEAAINQS